ncbi:hypothetical protein [Psychrobacter sp. NG27]|uniref:hypothetical protein n=1 Tax=Psychrobacter sp. NG27 TaxID=2781966 RepID=UPI0018E04EA8|nr:hypothetical protein [Psychrobacter sp. NG27]MBI0425896.1 hypothetical protein [Psychrobacter sp. NG27]
MKTLKPFSFKTTVSAGLVIALLGTTVGCTVVGPGYDNQSVYRSDNNRQNDSFNRVSQQLRQDLRRKGYQVMDIRSDSYRGDRAITAFAKKNNQAYELKYTYPALRLISSNKRAWSNNWEDKKYQQDNDRDKNDKYKGNGKYKNDKRYKKDDVEDSIKRESRYPAIQRRAVSKVRSMGYRVDSIDLEEKNKRGVFEIEAKRGSQKYEILLSYPNLDVIRVQKD